MIEKGGKRGEKGGKRGKFKETSGEGSLTPRLTEGKM